VITKTENNIKRAIIDLWNILVSAVRSSGTLAKNLYLRVHYR